MDTDNDDSRPISSLSYNWEDAESLLQQDEHPVLNIDVFLDSIMDSHQEESQAQMITNIEHCIMDINQEPPSEMRSDIEHRIMDIHQEHQAQISSNIEHSMMNINQEHQAQTSSNNIEHSVEESTQNQKSKFRRSRKQNLSPRDDFDIQMEPNNNNINKMKRSKRAPLYTLDPDDPAYTPEEKIKIRNSGKNHDYRENRNMKVKKLDIVQKELEETKRKLEKMEALLEDKASGTK